RACPCPSSADSAAPGGRSAGDVALAAAACAAEPGAPAAYRAAGAGEEAQDRPDPAPGRRVGPTRGQQAARRRVAGSRAQYRRRRVETRQAAESVRVRALRGPEAARPSPGRVRAPRRRRRRWRTPLAGAPACRGGRAVPPPAPVRRRARGAPPGRGRPRALAPVPARRLAPAFPRAQRRPGVRRPPRGPHRRRGPGGVPHPPGRAEVQWSHRTPRTAPRDARAYRAALRVPLPGAAGRAGPPPPGRPPPTRRLRARLGCRLPTPRTATLPGRGARRGPVATLPGASTPRVVRASPVPD